MPPKVTAVRYGCKLFITLSTVDTLMCLNLCRLDLTATKLPGIMTICSIRKKSVQTIPSPYLVIHFSYLYIQYTVISAETTFGVTNVQTINYNLRIYNIRTTNFGSNLKKYNLKQVKELFPYSAVYDQVCPLWTKNKRFLLQNCLIYDVCRAFVVVTFVAVTFVSFNVSILWHFAGSMFRFVSYVGIEQFKSLSWAGYLFLRE